MNKTLKKILRFGAFGSLVAVVFFTNIAQKFGLTPNSPKDGDKNTNNLFASFSDVEKAHADAPGGVSYDSYSGPACDSGPCGCPSPH